jgi:hypothetical protein
MRRECACFRGEGGEKACSKQAAAAAEMMATTARNPAREDRSEMGNIFSGSGHGVAAFNAPMVALLVLWLAALTAAFSFLPLAGQEARGAIRLAVPG